MTSLALLSLLSSHALAAGPRVELIAVLNQALPTQAPADPSQRFTCTATWTLPDAGNGSPSVEPGCPMEAEVLEAAHQWRFRLQSAPKGTEKLELSARFVYGVDDQGTTGWFYRMGAEPGGPSVVEVPYTYAQTEERVNPRFSKAMIRTGAEEVDCTARFTIDEQGRPTRVETFGCQEEFQTAVLEATGQWRFKPVIVDGKPSKVAFTLRVKFRLK